MSCRVICFVHHAPAWPAGTDGGTIAEVGVARVVDQTMAVCMSVVLRARRTKGGGGEGGIPVSRNLIGMVGRVMKRWKQHA